MAVDDHPFSIANAGRREAGDMHVGALERDPAAALDRINVERRNAQIVQFRNPAR
jgi:hypothetical protein